MLYHPLEIQFYRAPIRELHALRHGSLPELILTEPHNWTFGRFDQHRRWSNQSVPQNAFEVRNKCVMPEEGRFSHRCLLIEGNSKLIFLGSLRSRKATKAFDLPKLFLRLRTKFHTSDFPMTLAKWFFDNSLVDYKGLEFYHHH